MNKHCLGNNITLYHGDCKDASHDIAGVGAIITDPPYGINFRSNRRTKTPKFDKIEGDSEVDTEILRLFTKTVLPDSCLMLFTRWDVEHHWLVGIQNAGWTIQSQLIWFKGGGGIGNLKQSHMAVHENMWFATRGQWRFPNKRPSSVYQCAKYNPSDYVHSTQKPVELMTMLIRDLTAPGDIVYDPFMGSGSTGLACIQMGRRFIGVEKDDTYFELAKGRIEAELNSGRLF